MRTRGNYATVYPDNYIKSGKSRCKIKQFTHKPKQSYL